MIDEHDAERDRTGEQQGAAGEPESSEAAPANQLVTADELELAEDAALGEAERALLRWAFRQRQRAAGEPLLPTGDEPLPPPPETPAPPATAAPTPAPRQEAAPAPAPPPGPLRLWPEPTEAPPAPQPEAAPGPPPAPPPAPQPRPRAAPAWPPVAAPARAGDRQATPWERLHEAAEEAISALVAAGGPDPRDYASPRLGRRAKMVIAVALVVLFMVSALGGFVGYRLTHRAAGIQAAAPATRSV